MIILSFDCATKTGWAYCDESGKIIESGVQDFTKRRGESNGILFLKFRKWIKDLVVLVKPDVISYERAHFRGGAATELCVGLQTRVQEIASEYNIETLPIHTSEIKKFATGNGKADKIELCNIASKHIGRKVIDDNESDAIHLSMFTASQVGSL